MAKDPIFNDDRFEVSMCGPTRKAGVYAICILNAIPSTDKTIRVVYIGSARDVHKRVSKPSHIYRRLFNILKKYYVSTFYFECNNYRELEKELIKKYRPRFNIQHKN